MKMQSYFISLSKASRSFILSMLAVITPFYLARFVGVFDVGIIVLFSIAFSTLIIYLLPALKAKNGIKMYLIAGTLVIALLLNFIFLDFYVFIFSLILGSISLSGRDISPNQPIEQYAMAYYETDIKSKRNAFSLYNFFSYSSSIVAPVTIPRNAVPKCRSCSKNMLSIGIENIFNSSMKREVSIMLEIPLLPKYDTFSMVGN